MTAMSPGSQPLGQVLGARVDTGRTGDDAGFGHGGALAQGGSHRRSSSHGRELEQLCGVRPRGVGVLLTRQHAGELAYAVVARDQAHVRLGDHVDPVVGRLGRPRGAGRRTPRPARGASRRPPGVPCASAASRRPTSIAARPPTPASTSSNTNVRAAWRRSRARWRARPRWRASRGTAHRRTRPCPAVARARRRAGRAASRRGRRRADRARPAASTTTRSSAPPIARPDSSSETTADSRSAPPRRPAGERVRQRSPARRRARPRSARSSLDPVVAAVEVEQPPPGGVRPREHLVDGRAVAAGQVAELGAATLRGVEPQRVAPAGPPGSAARSAATSASR